MEWISVKDRLPDDSMIGSELLFFRPLAKKSGDNQVAIKVYVGKHTGCWNQTVPERHDPFNPTGGYCHVTHWMPLPSPPEDK